MNAQTKIDLTRGYDLSVWLEAKADELDLGGPAQSELLSKLASSGLFRVGLNPQEGGDGRPFSAAIDATAEVARYSLTAAFVAWGHRTFIEYLLASPNPALREKWLAPLLSGDVAGATALSNAMKYLSGIEQIQISAQEQAEDWLLKGRLFWVTNLDPKGFLVAAIVQPDGERPPAIVLLESDQPGLERSADLNLLALKGSSTAAIEIDALLLNKGNVIHPNALEFCPSIRPRFLGLQIGLSIGHIRASLDRIRARADHPSGGFLRPTLETLEAELRLLTDELYQGVDLHRFESDPARLFELRISLAELVQSAANQELEASGGQAYLVDRPTGFARRWHEAAFIPVVTPSVSQLKGELAKRAMSSP